MKHIHVVDVYGRDVEPWQVKRMRDQKSRLEQWRMEFDRCEEEQRLNPPERKYIMGAMG